MNILKKIERLVTIALMVMLLVSIILISIWLLRTNSIDNQSEPKPNSQTATTVDQLTDIKDYLPDKYTLNQDVSKLSFTKENGDSLSVADLRGKVVVLNFWASWCPYCQKELEQSESLKNTISKYADVEYLLVDRLDGTKETKEKALAYVKEHNIPFTIVFDESMKAYKELGLKIVPTTLVIDKAGVLRVWHPGRKELRPNQLKAMLDYALFGGAAGVRQFLEQQLTNSKGGVKTNYQQEKSTTLKSTDVLSESQGLVMDYAVEKGDKQLFDKAFSYVMNVMRRDPLASWVVTEKGPARVNSVIDDLRIYRAIQKADALWGGYTAVLDNYEKALRRYNTQNQHLINEYDFKYKDSSNKLKLCFADFEALSLLAEKSIPWQKVYDNSLLTVKKGYIGDQFPVYFSEYDYKKNTYNTGEINMAEEMMTLLHLAKINQLNPKTLEWLKAKVDGEGIFAKYKTDGTVVNGYRYESTAIYGIVSMIGKAAGDQVLANKALARMETMRIFDADSKLNGAFGNTDGSGIYSFDQCIALLAYEQFDESVAK